MIYIDISGKGPEALAIQGSADDITTELATILIELQGSDKGLRVLTDAFRVSVDPEVKKIYKDSCICMTDSEHEDEKDRKRA